MNPGNFSISLNVKDIKASVEFYKALGFEQFGGDISQNWCILKNGTTNIGLFQGMFEENILTFNPKWDGNGELMPAGDDIREIEQKLKDRNIEFTAADIKEDAGPGYFIIKDPDGNTIMFDQHV